MTATKWLTIDVHFSGVTLLTVFHPSRVRVVSIEIVNPTNPQTILLDGYGCGTS